MKMLGVILCFLAFIACLLFIGELSISILPFSIKLLAWKKMVAVLFFIVGYWFLSSYYTKIGYEQGSMDAIKYMKSLKEEPKFSMILYHGNTSEVRETLEQIGFLPLSSPKDGGYILVAGNRYTIIHEIDESIPELFDCSDSLDLFIEKCQCLSQRF